MAPFAGVFIFTSIVLFNFAIACLDRSIIFSQEGIWLHPQRLFVGEHQLDSWSMKQLVLRQNVGNLLTIKYRIPLSSSVKAWEIVLDNEQTEKALCISLDWWLSKQERQERVGTREGL